MRYVGVIPAAKTPRIEFDVPFRPALADVRSPKSVEFDVVAIVIKSIAFVK